MLSCSKVHHS